MIFVFSFITGLSGAWCIYKFGSSLGMLDVPNKRSSHDTAVPKGGGRGILAAFVFCAILFDFDKSFWVSALFLSLVSFVGDRFEIKLGLRLIVQFLCSFIFLTGFLFSKQSGLSFWSLIIPLSVFIVGTSNLYNFMDGIDGIAGITGVVGFGLISFYGFVSGFDLRHIILSLAVVFSCLGFLFFNIPEAKVFMGDIGSILLGFVFACLIIILSKSFLDFISLAGFLYPFYADELTTMPIRIIKGEKLNTPHRRHLYQVLANEYKIPHWIVSLAYGGLQLIIGTSIFIVKSLGVWAVLATLLLYFSGFIIISCKIRSE